MQQLHWNQHRVKYLLIFVLKKDENVEQFIKQKAKISNVEIKQL